MTNPLYLLFCHLILKESLLKETMFLIFVMCLSIVSSVQSYPSLSSLEDTNTSSNQPSNKSSNPKTAPTSSHVIVLQDDRLYRFIGSEPNQSQIAKMVKNNFVTLREENYNEEPNDLMILNDSPSKVQQAYIPPLSSFDPFANEDEESKKKESNTSETESVSSESITKEVDHPHHPKDIPENIFIKMNEVSSPEDFITKFVDMNDGDEDDVVDNTVEEDGDIHVEGLERGFGDVFTAKDSSHTNTRTKTRPKVMPKLTSPAGCQVEMKTVDIKDPLMETHVFYPWCVRVPRCSGCCPSIRLKCVPTKTSIVNVTAVQLDYEGSLNGKFKYDGLRIFHLEKHESCRCECIQQQDDCNEHQVYRPEECRCLCKDPSKADDCKKRPDKIWIQDSCQCLCRQRFNCPTGSSFSEVSCKCEADAPPHLIFDSFPNIRIHSTIDVEFKKQSDFTRRIGSSLGINPDIDRFAHLMMTTTETTSTSEAEDPPEEEEDNRVFPLSSPAEMTMSRHSGQSVEHQREESTEVKIEEVVKPSSQPPKLS